MTRSEIENKIKGLRLSIAKDHKKSFKHHGAKNNYFNTIVFDKQQEMIKLSELWGSAPC
jgi:hypothetical protein